MAATGAAAASTHGKYRPIAELGHGGMAEVFLAVASGPAGFNKLVVVKMIREQFAEDPDFLSMFLDEARLAARLNHPNVVQTNEVGQDPNGRYFICMEFLEGQPLNRIFSRLGQTGALPLGMRVRIIIEALAGLHYAHELTDFDGSKLEVVHRDITPHNVFVTYAGQVKVVDFGIAKALSSASETRTGVLKGKVAYMAPEQAMGDRVDRRADVFGMGMVLWEALAGKRLYKGVTDVAILHKIVNADIPSPSSVQPGIPPELEKVCMKALARSRDDRYATAADFAAALEDALEQLGDRATLRDIGKLLEKHFEADRIKLKGIVEAQLAGIRQSGDHPTFDATRTGSQPKALPQFESALTDSFSSKNMLAGINRTGASAVAGPEDPTRVQGVVPAEHPDPSSLTASMATAQARAPSARNRALVVAAALAFGAGLLLVLFFARDRGQPAPQPAASATTTTTATTTTSEVAVTRTLRIESTPVGATVTEGAATLGKTPLSIPLDPALGTRHIVVALEGFMPYAIEQAPTREDVRVVVPLAPKAPAPATSASAEPHHKPIGGYKPVSPKPQQQPAPLDINTAR